MTLFLALLLIFLLLASWLLTVVGLPGNWLMAGSTAIYAVLAPIKWNAGIGWKVVVALLVLASLGEIVELVAGAAGTTHVGGKRRSAMLALVGSVAGGVFGLVIGLPIPLVGPLVAAVLFAGLGAMAGAVLGEVSAGRKFEESMKVGRAAFWGRLAGTLAKSFVGAVMLAMVIAAMVL